MLGKSKLLAGSDPFGFIFKNARAAIGGELTQTTR